MTETRWAVIPSMFEKPSSSIVRVLSVVEGVLMYALHSDDDPKKRVVHYGATKEFRLYDNAGDASYASTTYFLKLTGVAYRLGLAHKELKKLKEDFFTGEQNV